MKKLSILLTALLFTAATTMAQMAVNDDGSNPDGSAMLDVKSISKGFLPPRMTTAQRDLISAPADGLVIFNTTSLCIEFYAQGYWNKIAGTIDIDTVTNTITGEIWIDRNLGTSQVATSSTDSDAYGNISYAGSTGFYWSSTGFRCLLHVVEIYCLQCLYDAMAPGKWSFSSLY